MLGQCYCAKCGEYMNIPVEFWGKWYHSWCVPNEPPLTDLYPEMDEMVEQLPESIGTDGSIAI